MQEDVGLFMSPAMQVALFGPYKATVSLVSIMRDLLRKTALTSFANLSDARLFNFYLLSSNPQTYSLLISL